MLRFRDSWPHLANTLPEIVDAVLSPGHFYITPGFSLEWERVAARPQRWELFRGRLVDAAHTRQEKTFEEWNVYLIEQGTRSAEPLLSLKLDSAEGKLHVVRGLLCHVWEGYDSGGGVILSREATRWIRELTGTIVLSETPYLLDELACQVYHAVVGASRLPLTSSETPLPAFSLGRLAFIPGMERETPATSWRDLIESTRNVSLNPSERVKWLETLLHAVPTEEMNDLARAGTVTLPVLARMFNEVSLSPWTDLTGRSLALLALLEHQGHITGAEAVDFLADRMLQTVRHLTAYDLVTFHHRGANYPDALLLDLVLKEYLRRIESTPELFEGDAGKRRRRALRQAWMQRRAHEGLPIPDAPTSPGENQRVLPPPHVRVPEEQILNTLKRRRVLHEGDPLALGPRAAELLKRSLGALNEPAELLELGLALYLDRPLGVGKMPGEPDRTVLLSHRAFSRSIALRRLHALGMQQFEPALETLPIMGIPLGEIAAQPRPGAVSLADARQAASDFVFLRTVPATVAELFRQYDFRAWDELQHRPLLIVPRQAGTLTFLDRDLQPCLEVTPDASEGYIMRAGRELLRAGLRLPDGSRLASS